MSHLKAFIQPYKEQQNEDKLNKRSQCNYTTVESARV